MEIPSNTKEGLQTKISFVVLPEITWSYSSKSSGANYPSTRRRSRLASASDHPDWTQQQIADEVGCSQPYVSQVISKNFESKELVIPDHISGNASKVEAMAELPEHGEIGKGRVRVDNVNSKAVGGNDTEYTLRRLKRDAPELLEAIKRGELSVNAAATLESRKGYRSTQRETVPEPSEPGRGKVKEPHDAEVFGSDTSSRLRAINRAPEIVGKLYDQGLISQVDAASTPSPPTRNAQQAR
jgi:hypothetical protein